eukprot:3162254-Rhodomonas_salina.1
MLAVSVTDLYTICYAVHVPVTDLSCRCTPYAICYAVSGADLALCGIPYHRLSAMLCLSTALPALWERTYGSPPGWYPVPATVLIYYECTVHNGGTRHALAVLRSAMLLLICCAMCGTRACYPATTAFGSKLSYAATRLHLPCLCCYQTGCYGAVRSGHNRRLQQPYPGTLEDTKHEIVPSQARSTADQYRAQNVLQLGEKRTAMGTLQKYG